MHFLLYIIRGYIIYIYIYYITPINVYFSFKVKVLVINTLLYVIDNVLFTISIHVWGLLLSF